MSTFATVLVSMGRAGNSNYAKSTAIIAQHLVSDMSRFIEAIVKGNVILMMSTLTKQVKLLNVTN